VLCKRMRDGKQMCQDFEDFIRQRYVAGINTSKIGLIAF